MNSTRRLAIITLLTIVGSLVLTEARYHDDDSPRHRHRHRHEVSSLTARRNHEPHRLEVDDDMKEDEEDDDEEDYYRPRHYQPRLEPPYRGRYHANMRHEVNFRHVEDAERRRRFGFNVRGHRTRPWSYKEDYTSRNHDIDPDDVQDDTEDYDDYERPRWHYLDDEDSSRWRSYPVHRKTDYYFSHRDWIESRREWRARKADLDHRRKINYQREAKRWYSDDDYDYDSVDELEKNIKLEDAFKNRSKKFDVSEASVDDEEDSIWRDAELAEDEDDSDKIDNDFYHDEISSSSSSSSSSSRTYDNIIKRLTSNDPKTPKPPSVKRDYRNIEIEKYLQRDTYGNLKYEPKNTTKNFTRPSSIGINRTLTKKEPINNIKYLIAPSQKPSIFNLDNRKIEQKKLNSKILEPRAKIKNLEQEDEDYSEDRRVDIQSDVTIGDNTEEQETAENDAFTSTTPSPIVVSKMTTTSSRPVITAQQNYDRRDSRLFSSKTPSHNELQSIHNSHKVQTKENRSQVYNYKNEISEIREARLHAIKVSREGSCQWPRARVIPVRDVYPSPSTSYTPHCAILHRCSDDTGCCRLDSFTCVPKKSHKVELYFHTTSIEGGNVVKLSFYNHTECECREKSEYGITSDSRPSSVQETEFRPYPSRQQHQSAMPPQNIRRPPQKKPCRCPSEFTPRITFDGECQCNCYEDNQNCIRARRGKGYFSLRDRLCIQNEECAVPSCEFGEYIKRQGRCPRKKDKFNEIANYPNHMSFNHRHRS